MYGTNRHYILGKVLKLSFRLKSFSKYVTLRQMVFKSIISIEDYLSQQWINKQLTCMLLYLLCSYLKYLIRQYPLEHVFLIFIRNVKLNSNLFSLFIYHIYARLLFQEHNIIYFYETLVMTVNKGNNKIILQRESQNS